MIFFSFIHTPVDFFYIYCSCVEPYALIRCDPLHAVGSFLDVKLHLGTHIGIRVAACTDVGQLLMTPLSLEETDRRKIVDSSNISSVYSENNVPISCCAFVRSHGKVAGVTELGNLVLLDPNSSSAINERRLSYALLFLPVAIYSLIWFSLFLVFHHQ